MSGHYSKADSMHGGHKLFNLVLEPAVKLISWGFWLVGFITQMIEQ